MKTLFTVSWLAGLLCISAMAEERQGVDYAAHEWGTFTSVQGADGAQLEWNPYVVAELPKFVYDRNRPNHEANRQDFALFAAKSAFVAKQRMETPVIYFYSPEKKTVDVRVEFPSGLMTEWYPHATGCDAQRNANASANARKTSYLEWKGVEIAPNANTAELPTEKGKSHYYAARETDASVLKIENSATKQTELEKFLFYRGVGHFDAPLQVTIDADGNKLKLQNSSKEPLRHLVLVHVENGKNGRVFRTTVIDELKNGAAQTVNIDGAQNGSREEWAAGLRAALEKQGLFAAEARAMVKTWEDSWLDESGVRVLYVLGRDWTDEILPLTISPRPEKLVRVMIGRAEVITPAMEIALQESIDQYAKGDRDGAVVKARSIGLGRFTDAAVRRLVKKNPGQEFSKAAFELAGKSTQPSEPTPVASSGFKESHEVRVTAVATK